MGVLNLRGSPRLVAAGSCVAGGLRLWIVGTVTAFVADSLVRLTKAGRDPMNRRM
jgi:hypothetical protein